MGQDLATVDKVGEIVSKKKMTFIKRRYIRKKILRVTFRNKKLAKSFKSFTTCHNEKSYYTKKLLELLFLSFQIVKDFNSFMN